jgi:Flp pilus assembly protein TadD
MTDRRASWRIVLAAVVLVAVVAVAITFVRRHTAGLPSAGSPAYEDTTRLFYRGLAALQVGLVDDAKREFTAASAVAPGEPAPLANLGLAHLRLGEFDAALPALQRATALAPSSGHIAFLLGRLETARGQRDEGIRHLRRAAELAPDNPHVRMALVQEIEYAAAPGADDDAQRLLEELVAARPDNPALLVERARLAAKRGDAALLADSIAKLERFVASWPPEVVDQYQAVREAAAAGNPANAARAVAFLRNVLARVPAFQESRASVTPSAELIADPLYSFVRLVNPSATPSAADTALAFSREPLGAEAVAVSTGLMAVSLDGEQPPAIFVTDGHQVQRVDRSGPPLPVPGGTPPAASGLNRLTALDWNHDFLMDLVTVGPDGVRLYLQTAAGEFADDTARASTGGTALTGAMAAWPADVEMDGDLDIVVGVRAQPTSVLRNNGDGTWRVTQPFPGVTGATAFVWGDIDGDADPDAAMIDERGELHVLANRQAGVFERMPSTDSLTGLTAITLGDVNADGVLDLVALDSTGAIRRASLGSSGWREEPWTRWTAGGQAAATTRLLLADLDNNGALDLIASSPAGTAVWLAGEDFALTPLDVGGVAATEILAAADLNGDGQLDLAGLENGRPVRFTGRAARGYHWQVIRPRAQAAAGDQRINSFGIGGEIEVRSGLLVQKQVITGPVVHAGLGDRTRIDVTRIVWPNGVPQAEFDPAVDQPIVAHQRLKGSCPWVFADNGTGLQFVTDFLWRSPLGLRINAQDTAGVSQTEDWVRIRGDQLAARDGQYDVRITAELWETHYIDHVSLLVVDHPQDVSVFVDERFARNAPALDVHPVRLLRPVARAWDHTGREVTDLVKGQDGRYLTAFTRGQYQGVADEHFVEMELDRPAGPDARLVAHGWVYPTDSSINVAIGQGGRIRPLGLSLEALTADGRWVVAASDLGFPAGKSKTILIDLAQLTRAGAAGARRLRLRTNLEIHWDAIGVADAAPSAALRTTRVVPGRATLGYRGFSVTQQPHRDLPEVPLYDRVASTAPRWRDLVGYYTRFGDVRDLVIHVEDRYVIMNAGDELALSFPAPPPPAPGWTRDFVLIGDGWNKDGDFNTSYSKTVLPLPRHGRPDYQAASFEPRLEDDPVYRQHPDDWQQYHTRFVAPRAFLQGLRYGPAR